MLRRLCGGQGLLPRTGRSGAVEGGDVIQGLDDPERVCRATAPLERRRLPREQRQTAIAGPDRRHILLGRRDNRRLVFEPLAGAVERVNRRQNIHRRLATAEQRRSLAQARAAAATIAWSMLRRDVTAVGQSGAPSDYEAVLIPYGFVKDTPRGSLSQDQLAAEAVAASNARLAAVMKADTLWGQRGVAGGDMVLSALAATTPFDRSRFDDPHKQAWEALSLAKAILDGPKLGFTASTKDRLLIFVSASDASAQTGEVVDSLSRALGRAGFQVASDQKHAALIAAITVESVDGPTTDLSGGFMEWVSTARIGVRAFWAADEKVLFSDEVVETARTREKGTVQARALLAGVDAIADRFTKAAQH